MKKLTLCLLMVLFTISAMYAQNEETKPEKKKGNLWGKIKTGVEKNTGFDVSKETLFVYPALLEWEMQLVSAIGDPETGVVYIKFKAKRIKEQPVVAGAPIRVQEVIGDDDKKYERVHISSYEHYSFPFNQWVEVPLSDRGIHADPSLKSFKSIKFYIGYNSGESNLFEARDIPITWEEKK